MLFLHRFYESFMKPSQDDSFPIIINMVIIWIIAILNNYTLVCKKCYRCYLVLNLFENHNVFNKTLTVIGISPWVKSVTRILVKSKIKPSSIILSLGDNIHLQHNTYLSIWIRSILNQTVNWWVDKNSSPIPLPWHYHIYILLSSSFSTISSTELITHFMYGKLYVQQKG